MDALQEENRKLKQTISVKDHELRQLREELLKRATVFPTPSITPLPTAEMTSQVAQLRDQLEERNKRIRELEALVARVNVHMPVVLEPVAQSSRNGHNDADRLMELIAGRRVICGCRCLIFTDNFLSLMLHRGRQVPRQGGRT